MNKKGILVGVFVLLLMVFFWANQSNTVDWTPTFNENGTNAMDTQVFYEQLPHWFTGASTKKVHTTFYEYDQHLRLLPVDTLKNYININANYTIDQTSFEALLSYVDYGNHALIAAHSFPSFVKDTLGFETDFEVITLQEEKRTLYLKHTQDSISYLPKLQRGAVYIKDTLGIKPLGHTIGAKGDLRTNFVGIPFGDGIFYIHTTPEIFTNYQMLAATSPAYLNALVSYLPNVPILWDKAIKVDETLDQSPLRFIKSNEALRWAWYLLLVTLGLFLVFNAKRRQRIVPIKEPLKNTTTAFVHTVSNLHYEAEDYNGVLQKMIVHFLEHIRSNYHLPTANLNQDFVKKLALKSGKPPEEVQQLISMIIKMRAHQFKTKEPLEQLNKAIENFYNRT